MLEIESRSAMSALWGEPRLHADTVNPRRAYDRDVAEDVLGGTEQVQLRPMIASITTASWQPVIISPRRGGRTGSGTGAVASEDTAAAPPPALRNVRPRARA